MRNYFWERILNNLCRLCLISSSSNNPKCCSYYYGCLVYVWYLCMFGMCVCVYARHACMFGMCVCVYLFICDDDDDDGDDDDDDDLCFTATFVHMVG